MIRCSKCDNETRTTKLVTAMGEIMVAGTIGTDPQPISAQVCSACGFIELYAPQVFEQPSHDVSERAVPLESVDTVPAVPGGTLVA